MPEQVASPTTPSRTLHGATGDESGRPHTQCRRSVTLRCRSTGVVMGHALTHAAGEIGQTAWVHVEFVALRDDGTVVARLSPDWPIFNEALADAVSSLPPRGSSEKRLSTYWIDRTLDRLALLQEASQPGPVASGNAYSLLFDGDSVQAVFDYGDPNEDVELMSVQDFRWILRGWRAAVLAAATYELAPSRRPTAEIPGHDHSTARCAVPAIRDRLVLRGGTPLWDAPEV